MDLAEPNRSMSEYLETFDYDDWWSKETKIELLPILLQNKVSPLFILTTNDMHSLKKTKRLQPIDGTWVMSSDEAEDNDRKPQLRLLYFGGRRGMEVQEVPFCFPRLLSFIVVCV